jgi:membrane protease YdiL (CAAX protease family)
MKTTSRRELVIRLLVAFLLTLALVPVVALLLPQTAFHRLVTRTLLICILGVLLLGRSHPRTWGTALRKMGLRGPAGLRDLAYGSVASLVVFAVVLGLSWAGGGRQAAQGQVDWPLAIMEALLAGLGVAILEETVWRGYLRGVLGAALSSFLYAAVHYFRPLDGSPPAPGPYDPLMAVRRLPEMFQSFTEPRHLTLGMLSLFIFGMLLCRLRRRAGTLWLSIGVHAGFVFCIALYRGLLQDVAVGSPWIYGGTRIYDGALGLAAVTLLWWAAWRVPVTRRVQP